MTHKFRHFVTSCNDRQISHFILVFDAKNWSFFSFKIQQKTLPEKSLTFLILG